MKILLLNVTYAIGSTGKIVDALKKEYEKRGHEVLALYGRHSTEHSHTIRKCSFEIESKIHHFVSLFSGNIYGGMFFSTIHLKKMIIKFKPDIVHLHCLNGYFVNIPSLISFLKKNGIKTVLTNHAEFMFTANCSYTFECNQWIENMCVNCQHVKTFNGRFSLNRTNLYYKKMFMAFDDFKTLSVTNVSPWLNKRSESSYMFRNFRNYTIINPVCNQQEHSFTNPFIRLNKGTNRSIVFFPTSSFRDLNKGGYFIYEISKRLPNYHFFVMSQSCNIPKDTDNITFLNGDDYSIDDCYYYSDCTLILSKRETFSMIVAESLINGTPVVGFQSGGPETICIADYCLFSKYGNIDYVVENIKFILNKKFDKKKIIAEASKKYGAKTISSAYIKIYEKLNN